MSENKNKMKEFKFFGKKNIKNKILHKKYYNFFSRMRISKQKTLEIGANERHFNLWYQNEKDFFFLWKIGKKKLSTWKVFQLHSKTVSRTRNCLSNTIDFNSPILTGKQINI